MCTCDISTRGTTVDINDSEREDVGVSSRFLCITRELIIFSFPYHCSCTELSTVYLSTSVVKDVFFRKTKQCPGSMWLYLSPYIIT